MRTETGRLVPFAGTGKVVLTLKFKRFDRKPMEQYYAKQASLPHFSGHYRQRGCGFGALAAGIGRVAIPFARRVILPAAKKLGRELLMSAMPELIDVAMKKKSPKHALKNTVTKTARKQLGGGRRRRKTPMNGLRRRRSVGARKRKTTIRRKTRPVRSRADFFSNIKMIANFLPNEATHSSLDLFEKQPLLITFEKAFDQKIGPVYSPNGPMLEFEITGDRNNFVELQKIYLEIRCKVTQSNGADLRYDNTDPTVSDSPFLVNNSLHSLFSDCTLSANGLKISNANSNFAHKSFIGTEFSNSKGAKDSWLKCQGYRFEKTPPLQ